VSGSETNEDWCRRPRAIEYSVCMLGP
jgi:hypothetical protein